MRSLVITMNFLFIAAIIWALVYMSVVGVGIEQMIFIGIAIVGLIVGNMIAMRKVNAVRGPQQ